MSKGVRYIVIFRNGSEDDETRIRQRSDQHMGHAFAFIRLFSIHDSRPACFSGGRHLASFSSQRRSHRQSWSRSREFFNFILPVGPALRAVFLLAGFWSHYVAHTKNPFCNLRNQWRHRRQKWPPLQISYDPEPGLI